MKEWIGELFYPSRCPVCDKIKGIFDGGICKGCRVKLEVVREPCCRKCGKPLFEEEVFCKDCAEKKCSYEYGYDLFVYNGSMKESVGKFKYHGRQEYAKYYAAELYHEYGEWMKEICAQALIPVPIHKNRYRKRGYNQAELIAKELEKLSGIPMKSKCLIRVKDTLPQKELSNRERRENLFQAFQFNEGAELNRIPKCVILIDDIYTTGSTLDECAKVLKKAGVQEVFFLCVCIGKS